MYVAKLPDAQIPSCRTFVELWNLFGCKFTSLAEGGTVYLLLIIAGLDLCWSVAKASHRRVLWEVAKLLRAPDDSCECHPYCYCIGSYVGNLRNLLQCSVVDMSLKHYCHNELRFRAEFQCIARQLQGCIDNTLSLYHRSHQLDPPVSLIFLLISTYCVSPVSRQHIWAPTARNSVICVNGKLTCVAGLLTRMPVRSGIKNEP